MMNTEQFPATDTSREFMPLPPGQKGSWAQLSFVLRENLQSHGTLIPSAQRVVWAAKQPLGKAALGALFA